MERDTEVECDRHRSPVLVSIDYTYESGNFCCNFLEVQFVGNLILKFQVLLFKKKYMNF